MQSGQEIEVSVTGEISSIGQEEWDACASAGISHKRAADPFTTYRFLKALEDSGSVGQGTGWVPRYIVARKQNQVIAVMPCYAKGHSQGEYIFDHNWAHAYENSGGRYYPKMQIAAPFTPAAGRRFLCKDGFEEIGRKALLEGAKAVVLQQEWSSFHITFCTEDEFETGPNAGLLQRIGQQFHWKNHDYGTFADFLLDLSSRKRKNIRKERNTASNFGGTFHSFTGAEIQPEHWDAFWEFYQDTGARKWGTPYLTRSFFECAHETMLDDIVLFMCERDGRWVAGGAEFYWPRHALWAVLGLC